MKLHTPELQELYHKSDRIMLAVNAFLFVLSLGLANWYDTWPEALLIGIPSIAVPGLLLYLLPGQIITRIAMAAAFMIFAALHIHQAHGLIEMHFGIFVLLAFLLFYRDWIPLLTAAGVIAIHHLSFNFLQESGYPVFVFSSNTGIGIVLLHAAFVVFETAVLVFMSHQFKKEVIQTIELSDIGKHMALIDGKVDITYIKQNPASTFAKDYNHFISEIKQAVSSSKNTAEHLNKATIEMLDISSQADSSMRKQQSETDQIATAITQMTATVQEVARSASEAANAASKADVTAKEGKQIVKKTIQAITALTEQVESAATTIEALNENSNKIGVVLEVIKGIADQTNLLALNAAIEAARAGEQGRGFAVVADEVRTLASRTQQSTEEIHGMIEELQIGAQDAVQVMEQGKEQAHQGLTQVNQAGEYLDAITDSVATISDMNTQIASASEEQSSVAEEINRNVTSISDAARYTADLVQSNANASRTLEELSSNLQQQVNRFIV